MDGVYKMDARPDVGDVPTEGMLRLPLRGVPKPRPRVTERGTYNPKEYTAWKAEVADELAGLGIQNQIAVPVRLDVVFATDYIDFQLYPMVDHVRPKHVRADLDNLAGGLMDALQDAGTIKNDELVRELHIWIPKR